MKGGKGFGYGWGNIVRPRKGSRSESSLEDSDMRSAKRRQEETNKLAEYIFARDIGHSKCMGMSKKKKKKYFRPMGVMGPKADEIIDMLWDSPIGALQRKKKKNKRTKNKKHKRSVSSSSSAPKSMSKMERRAGKVTPKGKHKSKHKERQTKRKY